MNELITISFNPVNAFFSIMCIVMLVYWLGVIVLGFDPDLLSIDFDADVDVDIDVDASADKNFHIPDKHIDKHLETGHSGFFEILRFFNFDQLPLMFMLTILFFSIWMINVNLTYYLRLTNVWIGLAYLIPVFFASLFIIKFLSIPLAHLYKYVNHQGEPEINFLGRRCTVLGRVNKDQIGQIELLVNGDPIKLYAKSNNNDQFAAKQEALIIGESADKKYYLIEKP